jgi:hypothetical protein
MKKNIIAYLVLFPISLIITQKDKLLIDKELHTSNFLSDTIRPKIDYAFKTSCADQFKGYFYSFGFWISNYYVICDYKGLNGDTIAVLSPKILTPEASSCRDQDEKIVNGRLLLINTKNKKSIYKNVIENNIGAGTCGGEFIEMTTNGFFLFKEIGQSCKFSYKIGVKYLDDDFYISDIFMKSKCPSDTSPKEISIRFNFKELKLSEYNRNLPESLRKIFNI